MKKLTVNSTDLELKEFYTSLNHSLFSRGMELLPSIRVRWSSNMGKALAMTYAKRSHNKMYAFEIVMNKRLFAKHSDIYTIESTLRHEAAHAWTAEHCGRLDHSAAWKHVAKILGDTGDQYAVANDKENEEAALLSAADMPTQFIELNSKQVHQLRCSLSVICRKHGCPKNLESFKKFVMPRFPQFSKEAMIVASSKLNLE